MNNDIELTNDFGGTARRRPEITVSEGVQVVNMADPTDMHDTIAQALGE